MARKPCELAFPPDPVTGCHPVAALTSVTRDCEWPQGVCISFNYNRVDDHGHIVDADDPALSRCKHNQKETPMTKIPNQPTARDRFVEQALAPDESPALDGAPEEQPPPLPAPPPAPLAVQPQAHVAVPSAPTPDFVNIKALVPTGGDGGSIITVLLAAIAVAGGGAGWKFYQSFAKQRHEQRMKQLEIEAARVEKVEAVKAEIAAENAEARREHKDDSHQKCSVERAVLEAKVTTLEARLADAEKAAKEAAEAARQATAAAQTATEKVEKSDKDALPVTVDFDEIEQRIAEIEKALKKAPSEKSEKSEKFDKKSKKEKAAKT